MIKRDPFQKKNSLSHDVLSYFTNREKAIRHLERYMDISTDEPLKIIMFYGVGGIGKTALQLKLISRLHQNEKTIPFARLNIEELKAKIGDPSEALLRLRTSYGNDFGIKFLRFDICFAVIAARQGSDPEPLIRINPALQDLFNFANNFLQAPKDGLSGLVDNLIRRYPDIENKVRYIFKTGDVIRLRTLEGPDLISELIRSFIQDLAEGLPENEGKSCRGILFMDTYESFWTGREEGISAQARLLDEWVRELVGYCLHANVGVLPVISGRERLRWVEDDSEWEKYLDQQLLDGLSGRDAQLFLSKLKVGPSPDKSEPTLLQEAILKCCQEGSTTKDIAFHPFYLSLCAEIVLNTRENKGENPSPDIFSNIPNVKVANELASRFLRSLNSRALELWITELSLTPRFDEGTALDLDDEHMHHNGRAGWERITGFSFMQLQHDGFYRLHKIMRNVLRARIEITNSKAVHKWFCHYWKDKNEMGLSWYHRWVLEPKISLDEWTSMHDDAIKDMQIARARELLSCWDETFLDEYDRQQAGDEMWGETHFQIAISLYDTPLLIKGPALSSAIDHYISYLKVYTETDNPCNWAMTQNNMGNAYSDLPTGDKKKNLKTAIECYEAALKIYTETDNLYDWAMTQNNMGLAYSDLPTGNKKENLEIAIECYEAALRVRTETDYPYYWAMTQNNMGLAYSDLPTGDKKKNLKTAIECYEAALKVYTETDYLYDWAMTQNNMGLAYSDLPTGDKEENLEIAIECYEAALKVCTETDYPCDWAMTQNNMGNAYSDLPTGDNEENLKIAIECYEAALRVRTEIDYPYYWAMTQNNMGSAYLVLQTGDKEKNLEIAIECYEAALRVRTETDYPYYWAMTQNNMGLAYLNLPTWEKEKNLKKALSAFKLSQRGYKNVGMEKEAMLVMKKIVEIIDLLAEEELF
jgi:tetratricopeptide (TPR) repeat protein